MKEFKTTYYAFKAQIQAGSATQRETITLRLEKSYVRFPIGGVTLLEVIPLRQRRDINKRLPKPNLPTESVVKQHKLLHLDKVLPLAE